MKTYIFFAFVNIVVLVCMVGCSNSYINSERNVYYLKVIDSSTFEKYNFFYFIDQDSERYYVLSRKVNLSTTDKNYLSNRLEIGKKYPLHLFQIDTTIVASLRFVPTRQIEIYFIDSTTIWQQDTFRTDIYMTDEIRGLYISGKH